MAGDGGVAAAGPASMAAAKCGRRRRRVYEHGAALNVRILVPGGIVAAWRRQWRALGMRNEMRRVALISIASC